MNFYQQRVLPYLLEWSMSGEAMTAYRRSLLAEVQGDVLEIGFGTGLNLPHYDRDRVRSVTTVDPNPGMNALAQKRIAESPISVDAQILNGEALPMANDRFDSVVSTWTLCSIPNVQQALREVHRVLKPGGKFFFIEHGLSDDPQIQTWQNRLTPLQKVIADGCHLNRNIQQLVEAPFQDVQLERFYGKDLPKFVGYFYKGVATKGY